MYSDILPSIVTRGQVYRVEAGHTAHLSCSVSRLGQFVVMWKQGGRVISAGSLLVRKDDRFRLQLSGDNNFDLEIEDIGVEDSSEYQCEVDILGRPISIIHRLEVMVAPQVSRRWGVLLGRAQVQAKESRVRLRKGQNYTLRCSAHGQPNPRIVWTKKVGLYVLIKLSIDVFLLKINLENLNFL